MGTDAVDDAATMKRVHRLAVHRHHPIRPNSTPSDPIRSNCTPRHRSIPLRSCRTREGVERSSVLAGTKKKKKKKKVPFSRMNI
ncbi:unnamed protein product [Hydatigera taeniaeformis]|uniref:Uncharacterized protein n=1 Tax=Hydatigena taeniaeformis TaxID=6205 RepID=A0A0R3X8B4_HYDTA|nr:unnamed protein product [Hydatigera taeniaeformis]